MREIHTDPEVVAHAISDAINQYVRELVDRGVLNRETWAVDFGIDGELMRLKYEIAEEVAARWTVSWRRDDA